MAHTRKARLQERRSLIAGLVKRILERVVSGSLEAAEGIRQVRTIYLDESALLPDLKTMIDSVDGKSSEEMIAAAREWLGNHPAVS